MSASPRSSTSEMAGFVVGSKWGFTKEGFTYIIKVCSEKFQQKLSMVSNTAFTIPSPSTIYTRSMKAYLPIYLAGLYINVLLQATIRSRLTYDI
jgi:predicted lipase